MNKKLKKGLTTTMAAAMGLGVVIPAVPVIAAPATSGWVNTAAGWTYYKSGVKATGWVLDGGKWYLLDSNGVMKTGWAKDAGTWYFLNASGAMATGWVKDTDGKWYFLNTSGAMVANTWAGNYYLGSTGAMVVSTVTADGWTVDANGAWDGHSKAADLKAATDAVVKAEASKSQADIDAAKTLVAKLTVTTDVTALTARLNAIVTLLQVTSVSAINAQQILVTFNNELDETSAEDIANYDVVLASTGATLLDTTNLTVADRSNVTLQSDKKSVIIDLDPSNTGANVLAEDANYTVTVNKDSVKDTNGQFAPKTSKSFVFADSTAPAVQSVKATATGFTVKFTEPVDLTNKGIVKVDGVNLPATAIAAGADKFSVDVTFATVAGTSYSVYTAAFEDLLGNKSDAATTTAQYVKDTTAPVLQTIGQDGDLTLTLKFSEELAAGTTAKIYRDGTTFVATGALVQDADDETLYTVTLPASASGVDLYPAGQSSTSVKVELTNFKDAAGNVTTGLTKDATLTRTVKTPQVLETTWNGTKAVIKLDTVLDSTSEVASKLLVTDATGAEVTGATAAVASDATGTDANGKYIIVSGLSADKNYTLNFTKGFAKDLAVVPNVTGNYTLSLNTTSSALDKTAPTAPVISATGNVVTLVFNETLDSSSRDLSNFKLDGVALPTGSVVVLLTTSVVNDTVKITLPDGAVNADASYLLSYANIEDLAGNVATAGSKAIALTDTVQPTLKSAEVQSTSGKILLTFSENVTTASDADADFVVKVNGVTLASSEYVVAEDATSNDKVLQVTVTGVNTVGQTVTISTINTPSVVEDLATTPNNLVGGTSVTATQN